MCLVFDSFKSVEDAKAFAAMIVETHDLKATVYATQEEWIKQEQEYQPFGENSNADTHDSVPFGVVLPVVLVEREDDFDREQLIEAEAKAYGGVFAGT